MSGALAHEPFVANFLVMLALSPRPPESLLENLPELLRMTLPLVVWAQKCTGRRSLTDRRRKVMYALYMHRCVCVCVCVCVCARARVQFSA